VSNLPTVWTNVLAGAALSGGPRAAMSRERLRRAFGPNAAWRHPVLFSAQGKAETNSFEAT
jgi:hypothetical protein